MGNRLENVVPKFFSEIDEKAYLDFHKSFDQWSRMPRSIDFYPDSSKRKFLVWVNHRSNAPDVDAFITKAEQQQFRLMEDGEYSKALDGLKGAITEAGTLFSEKELTMAQVHLLRAIGSVYLNRLFDRAHTEMLSGYDAASDVFNLCLAYMKSDERVYAISPISAQFILHFMDAIAMEDLHDSAQRIFDGHTQELIQLFHGEEIIGTQSINSNLQ